MLASVEHATIIRTQADLNWILNSTSNSSTGNSSDHQTANMTSASSNVNPGQAESASPMSTDSSGHTASTSSSSSSTTNNVADVDAIVASLIADSKPIIICGPDFTAIAYPVNSSATGGTDASLTTAFNLLGSNAEQMPNAFTLFPKLPDDVRKMIWQKALPDGRNVFLRSYQPLPSLQHNDRAGEDGEDGKDGENGDDGETGEDDTSGNKNGKAAQLKPPVKDKVYQPVHLPFTLFINKESRNVTKELYTIVHAIHADSSVKPLPYVFAPTRDTVCATLAFALNTQSLYNRKDHCWFFNLTTEKRTEWLKSVTKVVVEVDTFHFDCRFHFDGREFMIFCSHLDDDSISEDTNHFCWIFNWFPSLKEIEFIIESDTDKSFAMIRPRRMFVFYLQEVLARYIEAFDSGEIPNIALTLMDGGHELQRNEFKGGRLSPFDVECLMVEYNEGYESESDIGYKPKDDDEDDDENEDDEDHEEAIGY